MATTTLGGVTLANPRYDADGCERQNIDVGTMHEMADGSVVYDYVASRFRWTLRWSTITAAEMVAIQNRYLVKTAQVFKPPNSTSTYTVFVEPNTWRETYLENSAATAYYDCEMGLMEQA